MLMDTVKQQRGGCSPWAAGALDVSLEPAQALTVGASSTSLQSLWWCGISQGLCNRVLGAPLGMFDWAELLLQIVAWSSKKYQERNLHTTIPVFIAGACFMCALT